MTYSILLDGYTRLAAAAGRFFAVRRLPAAVTLAMILALATGILPGSGGNRALPRGLRPFQVGG